MLKHQDDIDIIDQDCPYPQWQSLPQTLGDPGDDGQHEQNIPSSSSRLLILLVRYIS